MNFSICIPRHIGMACRPSCVSHTAPKNLRRAFDALLRARSSILSAGTVLLNMKCALLVGINYLSTPENTLHGCIDDVVNMSAVLKAQYGYSDVVVMRDDTANSGLMPTRANMMGALRALIARSAACDEIWIHYSGHGSQIRDTNRNEADGLDEVVVPSDYATAGFITDDELYDVLKNAACRTIMLFDSCHSGSVCNLQWGFECATGNRFLRTQNNRNILANKNVYMFSGCKDAQTSADTFDSTTNQYVGAMTSAFLSVLAARKYDTTLAGLHQAVQQLLSSRGFSQKPVFSSSSATPDWRLVPAGNVAKPASRAIALSMKF
jgi:metacaspase-1